MDGDGGMAALGLGLGNPLVSDDEGDDEGEDIMVDGDEYSDGEFIQEDDGDGFDGEEDAWGRHFANYESSRTAHATSVSSMRPVSASNQGKRPVADGAGRSTAPTPDPALDRFRVPVQGAHASHGADLTDLEELKVEALSPSFVAVFQPLVASKIAIGGSRMLLEYLERGYPEYCVEAVDKAVNSLARLKGKDTKAVADMSYRLVVIGNYCGALLMEEGQHQHALDLFKKVELLTSTYTSSPAHSLSIPGRCLLRVWTLTNLGILHEKMHMPLVAWEYFEGALDHATAG
ncbi:hypothetical protein T484DRAFT_1792437 [Baffinella frigidus]|nr:hypothetical protein T484DRAFT_1792437 [Cryptophyta sp. CCMP2293]